MVHNYFLRAFALALMILAPAYAIAMTNEEPTREITGPNGEPLWDFLFVQKPPVQPAPAPEPVSTTSNTSDDEDLALDVLFNEEEITPANAPLPEPLTTTSQSSVKAETKDAILPEPLSTMSPELTNWKKPVPTTGIESMLPENTRWATPEEKQRFYDNLKMNTLDTTSPEAIESIRRMNTYQ